MKTRKTILPILFIVFFSLAAKAQYHRAAIWSGDMQGFASEDAINGVPEDVVLFAGSSTFTMWYSLQNDFPNSRVLNRAFGGSWMTDLIYFFDQVVKPYKPVQVVLYEGDNDLMEASKTPESFLDDLITMTRLINIHYPNAEILLVSIKPSPSRQSVFAKYKKANALMKAYASKFSYMKYIDTWNPMLNSDGSPKTELYQGDMLHMNRDGYNLWRNILEPHIKTSTKPIQSTDKMVYTESSHTNHHDYSWYSVTYPSNFYSEVTEKINSSSTIFHNGKTSLEFHYQGVTGGDWTACIAAPTWKIFDISNSEFLEYWMFSTTKIETNDLPYVFLESSTGTKTNKVSLSDYIDELNANVWTKILIPVDDWRNISTGFTFNSVKTVFFSQRNSNVTKVTFYIDDVIFRAKKNDEIGEGDIFIDFGSSKSLSAENWNNVTNHQSEKIELKDKDGLSSGITLKVTDPFFNGYNFNGTTSVSGDAYEFLTTATQDNFFGHALDWGKSPANPIGKLELSGLESEKLYNLTFFASRMNVSDNRETKYSVLTAEGTKTVLLNSSNNSDKTVSLNDLKPTPEGKLEITVEAGPNNTNSVKFFYLGIMKIVKKKPSGIHNKPSREASVYYLNDTLKIVNYTGDISIYDRTGRKITEGKSISGNFPVMLFKGIYIAQTEDLSRKFTVH